MREIFIIAEQRKGKLRESTFESILAAQELSAKHGGTITVILLGKEISSMAAEVEKYCHEALLLQDPLLENFNSTVYEGALLPLLKGKTSPIILIGHTSFGIELAPALSVALGIPLLTDCIGFEWKEGMWKVLRQIYSNKINAIFGVKPDSGVIATIRPGAFSSLPLKELGGKKKSISPQILETNLKKTFVGYEEMVAGDVDISQSDMVVAIGRGIGESEKLSCIDSFAETIGGVVACSRPIVDKKWMPKSRQVGTSGVTVKPKIYIAIGISGAFQHVGGIKGSPLIIAINKDQKAPIFRIASYGIVNDLFQVVPILEKLIKELKGEQG